MNQTTISDVLIHVQAEQAEAQAELDALFAQRRELPFSSGQERLINLQIEKAHGKVLALATTCGYLEARISIDEIYA